MIVIDGISYAIPVMSVVRKCDFLDKFAERTVDGVLHRELIGRYFNYQIQFGTLTNVSVYAALWNKLTESTEFHTVVVPGQSGDYTFTAYFSNVGDELRRSKGGNNYWTGLTVNFIAQSPVT